MTLPKFVNPYLAFCAALTNHFEKFDNPVTPDEVEIHFGNLDAKGELTVSGTYRGVGYDIHHSDNTFQVYEAV